MNTLAKTSPTIEGGVSNLPKGRTRFVLRATLVIAFTLSLFSAAVGSQTVFAQDIVYGQNASVSAGAQTRSSNTSLTDQIIIKYKQQPVGVNRFNPAGADQMKRLSAVAGITLTYSRRMSDEALVLRLPMRMPVTAVQAITARLLKLSEVEYVEPDIILQPAITPNDPSYSSQWNYFAPVSNAYGINAPAAWDVTTGSPSIVVAVVDTGITHHSEFVGRTVPGYDFIYDYRVANDGDGRDSDPSDPGDWITTAEDASGFFAGCGVSNSSWHGTHTAGTIGAASNNGIGVTGINWNSKILPVRVLGKCGGYTSDIIDGMKWAAGLPVTGVPSNANPAKVINLSLGGPGTCEPAWQNAINSINAAGVTIVVSAGNDATDASGFIPASCSGVISVAATNRYGSKAYYSNYGSTVEISAPGGDSSGSILSTLNTGQTSPVADTYAGYVGTSMAAPHVSGVVSLLYSINPNLTPTQILQILQDSATTFPTGSNCLTTYSCGSGIVNAGAAVKTPWIQLPGAFAKLSPANGVTNQPADLTLSWGTSEYAISYEYCFAETNPCSNWTSVGSVTSARLSSLNPDTLYYWNVRARNETGTTYANGSATDWTFRTLPIPGDFAKVSPTDGATNQPSSLTLSWGTSADATGYEYCYAKTDPCADWTSVGLVTSVRLSNLTPDTLYYWNARARNASGITYANGSLTDWSFTTQPLPGSFNKLNPANGATNQQASLTLSWGASVGATSYEYCYGKTDPCTNWTGVMENTSVGLSGLTVDSAYYWNVRARNAQGVTYANSSEIDWSFSTSPTWDLTINYLDPKLMQVGSPEFTLTVKGADFVPFIDGAQVLWNGTPKATTFVSPTELSATIPAEDLTAADAVEITVQNPGPMLSNALSFDVYTFADALPGSWYYGYVEGFYGKGITTGCATGPFRYCPDRAVTRAEMAVFILRSIHSDTLPYTPSPDPAYKDIFEDVPVATKEWMQTWIEEFYESGMTTGCGTNPLRYCPERQVTRAEMAVFVLRAMHGADYQPPAVSMSSFSDVPTTGKEWMMPWIEEFYVEGLTTGCKQTPTLQYCPEQSVTRAEMATFLDRAFGFPQLP